jgi:ribosome biogenesis protein ERB1
MLSPKSISADQGATEEIIAECIAQNPQVNSTVKWIVPADSEKALGYCVIIKTPEQVSSVTWHRKGDYFATTCPQATTTSVLIHQLSKKHSQGPFKKSPGIVQKVLFHPSKPILFVAVILFKPDSTIRTSVQFDQAGTSQEAYTWSEMDFKH